MLCTEEGVSNRAYANEMKAIETDPNMIPIRLLMYLPIHPPMNIGKKAVNMMPMDPKFRLICWDPVFDRLIKPTAPINAPLRA